MKLLAFSDNNAELELNSPEETRALGRILGAHAYPGLCLPLFGTLGAGKTLLTQGIGDALGIKRIKSPTFVIVNEHNGLLPLVHADLYRLSGGDDVDSLGFEEYLEDGCLLVVEWADRWYRIPKSDRIDVFIDRIDECETRRVKMKAYGEDACDLLERLVK